MDFTKEMRSPTKEELEFLGEDTIAISDLASFETEELSSMYPEY
jgi:hypothetical protein